MHESIQRVILQETLSRDEIDDALSACGCKLVNIVPPSESHPGQMLYASSDRAAVVALVEDGRLGVLYLTGQGESAQHDLQALSTRLACYDEERIDELLSRPEDEGSFTRGLGLMALCAFDPPRVEVFRTAFAHPSASVRHTALIVASYAPAQELRPDIAELAAGDEEPMVRILAERVLESFFCAGQP